MKDDLWIGIIYVLFRVVVLAAILYYCIYEIRKARKR